MPMELGQLPYKEGTYEAYLGLKGLKRLGITIWRECVHQVVVKFISALELDDVVIGGGNATKLDKLPPGCRAGEEAQEGSSVLDGPFSSVCRRKARRHRSVESVPVGSPSLAEGGGLENPSAGL